MIRTGLGIVLMFAACACAQPPEGLERTERALDPMAIGDRTFHLKLTVAHPKDTPAAEAIESIQITDTEGAVHWQRDLPFRIEEGRVEEAVDVDAQPLQGKRGRGILVTYSVRPEAPGAGRSWQVFGIIEGKLRPFGKPIAPEGGLAEYARGSPTTAAFDDTLPADVLHFRVWTGRLFAVVPVALDWDWGTARPAYPAARSRFGVAHERRPVKEDAAVTLFAEPNDRAAAAKVNVRRSSKIEILSAEGAMMWDDSDEQVGLAVSDDLWLGVRIDGREGWLHSDDDFDAIGLPEED